MTNDTTQKASDKRRTLWDAIVRARSAEAARLVEQRGRRYL